MLLERSTRIAAPAFVDHSTDHILSHDLHDFGHIAESMLVDAMKQQSHGHSRG